MAETIFYRPQWSQLAEDGTLIVPASIYDDHSHSSAVMEVPPTAEDYPFWRWVVTQDRYLGVLDQRGVANARAEFNGSGGGECAGNSSPIAGGRDNSLTRSRSDRRSQVIPGWTEPD